MILYQMLFEIASWKEKKNQLKSTNMNLLSSFLRHHLPAARKMESIPESVAVYSGEGKLFIIAMDDEIVITEQKKEQLLKYFEQQDQKKHFITLFESKEAFQKYSDQISWGSYAWIATDPVHKILILSWSSCQLKIVR